MNKYHNFTFSVYWLFNAVVLAQIKIFFLIVFLCLTFITQKVSAEQSEQKISESVKEQLTAIKISDISGQAGEIEDRLQSITIELSENDIDEQTRDTLKKQEEEFKNMQVSLDTALSKRYGKTELQALQSNWKIRNKSLTVQQEYYKNRAEQLGKAVDVAEREKQVWRLTQKEAQRESAPASVKKHIAEVLVKLGKFQAKLKKSRNSALDILSRVTRQQDQVDAALGRLETAEHDLVSNVLVAQDLPLWQSWSNSKVKIFPENSGQRLLELTKGLVSFIKAQHISLLIQAILTLLLGWFLSRRNTFIREEAKSANYGLDALQHPWSAAILFSLYMTPFVYADRTLGFIFSTIIISLPLWLYVMSGMLPAAFRPSLIIMAFLVLIEQLRSVFGEFTILTRCILILEFTVIWIVMRWLLVSDHFQKIPDHIRRSFWFKLMHTWLYYSVPAVAAGIVAVILGYSELANRIIMLAIWGSVAGATFIAIVRIIEAVLQSYIDAGQFDFLNMIRVNRHPFVTLIRRILRALGFFAWAFLLLRAIQLLQPVHELFYSLLTAQLGIEPIQFSLGGILAFAFTLWFSWLLARFVNLILDNEIFSRVHTPPGVPFAITTFSRYTILVVGFLAAVSVLGFPLDKITLVLGALGVGIGFGLQNITNNFVSGIILLFERPIRVGDKIQLDDLIGRVASIGIRASKITSFEGSDVIVPNADFISSRVINWTFSDEKRRVIVPVGVAYGTDPETVLELLLKVAKDHPEIIDNPEPEALFQNFGESSLDFELRAWTESPRGWVTVKSDLTVRMHKALQEANIEIPFPQRDVNLKNISELQEALITMKKR
jgi:potassium-dependent mechanosensitive channel